MESCGELWGAAGSCGAAAMRRKRERAGALTCVSRSPSGACRRVALSDPLLESCAPPALRPVPPADALMLSSSDARLKQKALGRAGVREENDGMRGWLAGKSHLHEGS